MEVVGFKSKVPWSRLEELCYSGEDRLKLRLRYSKEQVEQYGGVQIAKQDFNERSK